MQAPKREKFVEPEAQSTGKLTDTWDGRGKIDRAWHGTILDSIADGVFTVDDDWRITSFNRAAEQITGYTRHEAIGRTCHEVFKATICKTDCALRRTLASGAPVINLPIEILSKQGARLPISISTGILRGPDGERAGGVETFRDLSTIEELRRHINRKDDMGGIVGRHPRLQRILEILPDVAQSDATVLIQGPSGSGKGLVATTLHDLSGRRHRPMVKISCAALPEALLESELFGYVKGAFTDARRDKPGRLALADGGTLFLDEIGDVALSVQVKLLRVLQEREYEPLGATRTLHADVRIIAATNRDLVARIREGKFREDLFYRLNIVNLQLPGLAERREDVPRLVSRFVAEQRLHTNKDIRGVSDEAMALLLRHDYPGNVRELENAIEHAFVLCRGAYIEVEHLPNSIRAAAEQPASLSRVGSMNPRQVAEADVIRQTLNRNHGNRIETARELRMHRTTLWRKLRLYGIEEE